MAVGKNLIGRALPRIEDADLLRGRGRFMDDLPTPRGALHAAILRSPYAHAELLSLDLAAALELPGVECVVTGADARRWTKPFTAIVRSPVEYWCLATGRVRYAGEPIAAAVARDRMTALDAVERIEVAYRPLPPVLDAARSPDIVSDRRFRYGDPAAHSPPRRTDRVTCAVSAQLRHADRDLWRASPNTTAGRGRLRRYSRISRARSPYIR